jgi:peroxiredoxin
MSLRLRFVGSSYFTAWFVGGVLTCLTHTVAAQTISGAPADGTPAATGAKVEPIAVPDGDAATLLKFIGEVKRRQPTATDRDSIIGHLTAIQNAAIGAADKIAAAQPTEDQAVVAAGEKLNALMMLRRIGEPDADARAAKFLDELKNDPRARVAALAKIFSLAERLQMVDHNDHAQVEQLVKDVRAYIAGAPLDGKHLSVAFQTARTAEAAGLTALAGEAYREFAAAFAKSDDAAVVANAKKLEGAARLVTLPGNSMDIKGKLVDGSSFDLASLKGKTVLVDFWATWCGPCIAELPTVRDCYAKYHDRGFEVVGISLDNDKQRLDDFLKRESLPWPVLFSDDPQATGWSHPLAEFYGIMAIPRAILINKEGKVVALQARGEDLWDLLAKEIGPAVVQEKPKPEAPEAKPAEPKP